ncbi:hypothetical protein [Curtobacterium sp. MCPF17_052]|uniref:hypothetical protein n=1 Tax=Curtobacterium sp. MCPF17_052 TaxID=2175655 RepID=UPI000DA91052|nr:hypothetical protein [Curtobacterium sp. MCPF17_052]WIB11423.1 hypothetical protein DEJ36_10420 [Curtobacterium sp. MCPF17_052]
MFGFGRNAHLRRVTNRRTRRPSWVEQPQTVLTPRSYRPVWQGDGSSREAYMRKRMWTIGVTALATTMVLLGFYGVKHVVARETMFGICNSVTDQCHDVPVETLELVAGLRWDGASAKVLESSASTSHGLLGSPEIVSGVLELHNVGDGASLGNGASYPAPQPGQKLSTDEGERVLRRLGATDVKTLRQRDQLVVLRGETKTTSLVYVYSLLSR